MPEIHHYGYAIAGLEASTAWTAQALGARPFFEISHMKIDSGLMRGREVEFDHSSAFGLYGAG